MTTKEFSEEFDILYNSICSNQAPGLTQYEKSVLLTEAQEELTKECYSSQAVSFERNEAVRRSLDALIRAATITPSKEDHPTEGVIYTLPEDLWVITHEEVRVESDSHCLNNKLIEVVPITQDEYTRVRKNPYRGPTRSRVLRLDIGDNKVALVSIYQLGQYKVWYITKPTPIILEDLPQGYTIDGLFKKTECELNSYTHRIILEKAVNKAAAIYKQN